MKRILFIALLFSVPLLSKAQLNWSDSLVQAYKNAPNDSVCYILNGKILNFYFKTNLDSALKYAETGLMIAKRNRMQLAEVIYYSLLADQLTNKGKYAEALKYFLVAFAIAENPAIENGNNWKLNNDKSIHYQRLSILSGTHQNYRILMERMKNRDQELFHAKESKRIAEEINALCDEYLRLSYHGLRAKDKSFNATMIIHFDTSLKKINIIPQDIGRLVLNLLTNAFYAVSTDLSIRNDVKGDLSIRNDVKGDLSIRNEVKGEALAKAGGDYEPTVTVSTKKVGDKVEISVADNGNGIPQKVLDKIFQPFFTTKPTGQGTGLGLSYDIVKAHSGEIKVETNEKAGTVFIN